MEYDDHALEQMASRGISEDDVEWCVAGNNYVIQQWNGRRKYRRYYQGAAGQSAIFVVTNGVADYVITTWIRGADDPGV